VIAMTDFLDFISEWFPRIGGAIVLVGLITFCIGLKRNKKSVDTTKKNQNN
jgi:hypothetical protein